MAKKLLLALALLYFFVGKSSATCGFRIVHTGCDSAVQFIDTSSYPSTGYSRTWRVSDHNGAIVKSSVGLVFNVNLPPDTYCVTLRILNRNTPFDSCVVTECFRVQQRPTLQITATPVTGCGCVLTNITGNVTANCGNISLVTVDYGDNSKIDTFCSGLPNCGFSPNHNYCAVAGHNPTTYSIIIQAFNTCNPNCFVDTIITVTIIPPPVAGITATTATSTCNPTLQVNLTTSPAQTGTSHWTYQWSSSNPPISLGSTTCSAVNTNQVLHFYSGHGCHDIGLTVTDCSTGCSATTSRNQYVCLDTPGHAKICGDTIACQQVPVFLNYCGPNPFSPTCSNCGIFWNNGTTSQSSLQVIPVLGRQCETVKVVFDGTNCISRDTFCFNGYRTPNSLFTISDSFSCTVPTTFIVTPSPGASTDSCQFHLYDPGEAGHPVDSLLGHTFGSNPLAVTINHEVYCDAAHFIYCYCYTNKGCASSQTRHNVCIQKPHALFGKYNYAGCSPLTVSFRDTSTVNALDAPYIRQWIFPPGVTGISSTTSFNPSATFPNIGCWPVKLVITTQHGCRDTITDTVYVGAKLHPSFIIDTNVTCFESKAIHFMYTGNPIFLSGCYGTGGSLSYYDWIPGDPKNAPTNYKYYTFAGDTFLHIYTDTGHFTPGVVVSQLGCSSDTFWFPKDTIHILPPITKFLDSTTCERAHRYCIYYRNQTIVDSPALCTSYTWYIDSGTTNQQIFHSNSISTLITVCWPGPGQHNAIMYAYDSCDMCIHHKAKSTMLTDPSASFHICDSFLCLGNSTCITNTSSNISPGTSVWQFKVNGVPITYTGVTSDNFTFTPTVCGLYTITLINTDSRGCKDTLTKVDSLRVSGVNAVLTPDATVGCTPFTVNFTDNSTFGCSTFGSRLMDAGDANSPGSTTNPTLTHIYNTLGSYTATLQETNSDGCQSNRAVIISADHVQAAICLTPDSTCVGQQVSFCGNAPCDTPGLNPQYFWTIGSSAAPSLTTSFNPCDNVSFGLEGDVPITLTITSNGCMDSTSSSIHIHNPIANYYSTDTNFINNKLVLTCPNPPHTITFCDSSLYNVCNWCWDFGDGSFTNCGSIPGASPGYCVQHTYAFAGTFVVTLTVTSCSGCVSTITKDTIVIAGPNGNLTTTLLSSVCPCRDVQINVTTWNARTGEVILNGCTDTSACPPFHRLLINHNPPGTITNPARDTFVVHLCGGDSIVPSLTLSDGFCTYNRIFPLQSFYVDSPISRFVYRGLACSDSIRFTDSSHFVSPAARVNAQYYWYFNDSLPTNTRYSGTTIKHIFAHTGDYNVCHVVYNFFGCSDSICKLVHVSVPPVVNFTLLDTSICIGDSAYFTNTSTFDSLVGLQSLKWKFGDGDSSILQNPIHLYRAVGTYNVILTLADSNNCVKSDTLPVIINGLPTAHAGVDTFACSGACVQLNASGGVSCLWLSTYKMNDSSLCSPIVCTDVDTFYIVRVTDTNSCKNVDTVKVKVAHPFANFSNDTVCAGFPTHFTDHSTDSNGVIVSYHWAFGDGGIDSVKNPTHVYQTDNIYSVTLTVCDNHGCCKDTVMTTGSSPNPKANFVADTVCLGLATTFTDSSIHIGGTIGRWTWKFDPANPADTASAQSPTHVFATSGTHSVCLHIVNTTGCFADTCLPVFVYGLPVASFTADSVCLGNVTHLTSTSAPASTGGTIVSNVWKPFFPASTDSSLNLGSDTVTYPTAGIQTIGLHIVDSHGCVKDTTGTTLVYAEPIAAFRDSNLCSGNLAYFINQSTAGTNPIDPNNGYSWSLPSTQQNPTFTFATAGTYTVRLTVTDTKGCADSVGHPLTIVQNPTAKFSVLDTTPCLNDVVCPKDSSKATGTTIAKWYWSKLCDGNIDDSTQTPCFSYFNNGAGVYTLCLVVVDANGCVDTAKVSLSVNTIPVANFSNNVGCIGQVITFSDSSALGTSPIVSYDWTIYDSKGSQGVVITSQTGTPITYVFDSVGTDSIKLKITDAAGCSDTIVKVISVDFPPTMNHLPDTTICIGSTVAYKDSGRYTSFRWTPPTWIDNPNSDSVHITPLNTIKYYYTAVNGVCPALKDSLIINVIQKVPITVSATPTQIILGVNSNLTSTVQGRIDSIRWLPDSTLDCSFWSASQPPPPCYHPVATPTRNTTYTATIYYSLNGVTCSSSDSVTITIINHCGSDVIYVPNTFTPNNDGTNDVFMLRGLGIKKINYFRVFDRWGAMMFEANNVDGNLPQFGWDGTNKGTPLNTNVFMYTYELVCTNSETITGKGNVTLIK